MAKVFEVAVETGSEMIKKGDRFPVVMEDADSYIIMVGGRFFPYTKRTDEHGLINGEWLLVDDEAPLN